MTDLNHKRILITGASSGIGLELTRQLLQIPGVQVVGVARHIDKLLSIKNDRLFAWSADIAVPENIVPMLDNALAKMGGIDVFIACAGFAYYEKFENRDYGHIKRIFETNVLSPLYTLELFLQKQKPKKKVSFVTLSSALGKFGLPGYALYCSTKYALDGFHDSFRFEPFFKRRLHYMTVYPIGVNTPFWRNIHTNMPLPKPLQSPEAVAKAIIKGLKKGKTRVYTSKAFYLAWGINRIFPFFIRIYQEMHRKKFINWLRSQQVDTD